jgi:hypothetical protein
MSLSGDADLRFANRLDKLSMIFFTTENPALGQGSRSRSGRLCAIRRAYTPHPYFWNVRKMRCHAECIRR